jgi:competence protein ComEA
LIRAWEFTRSHLVAVGLVLLTGCLWAGYSLTQAQSSQVPAAEAPTIVVTPGVESAAPATPTPTPTPTIRIHVVGGVKSPGVVSVPEGARVEDAIEAAGGFAAGADPGELNLAAVAADGSQIIVGTKDDPRGEVRLPSGGGSSGEASANSGGQKVSLNTATAEQLQAVPGIGPVMAQRIVDWRAQHQRFNSVEELQEVQGIGAKTFENIAEYVQL